ncbi:MAG: outer membrane beta-barrel protein [Thermoanaerobaculia bacterium]|nr:outer membrane beta-barrel protein [Thermoanaerobaculia bacterium]
MKKLLALPALALLALALAAPPAAADGFGMDLGIHGGAVGTDGGDGNTFLGGAQARFHLFWIIGAEARASYYSDTYKLEGIGSVDVENIPFQASGMLYLIKLPKVGLYVLGGGTYSSLKVNGATVGAGEVTEKKWSAHAGAGLDIGLSSRISLNGDVRYVFLDADSVDDVLDEVASDYNGDFWTATIGLNFKLF